MNFTQDQIERAARLDFVAQQEYTVLEAGLLTEIGKDELVWLRRDPRVIAASNSLERKQKAKAAPKPKPAPKQPPESEMDGAMPGAVAVLEATRIPF